ncbi:MAG: iron-sulfur cluster assembly protein [Candidatus Heimdallarchaeota archaeon]
MRKEDVLEILKRVYDPDYRDKSIVELGLVNEEDIIIDDKGLEIEYNLTAPLCPFSSAIGVMIKYALEKKLHKPVKVKLKEGHMQSQIVNEILESEGKRRELLKKLESYGIFHQCVIILLANEASG